MSFPIFRQKYPSEVWMSLKYYTEHVETFPLMPVCSCPNRSNTADARVIFGDLGSYPDSVMKSNRIKVINNLKPRFFFSMVVCAAEILKMVKIENRVIVEKFADLEYSVLLYNHRDLIPEISDLYYFLRKFFLYLFCQLCWIYSLLGYSYSCQYYRQGLHLACSLRIFSWSIIIPSNNVSGLGGQPGTYISTGRKVPHPCTVL